MPTAGVIEAVDVLERAIVRHWFKNNGERRLSLSVGFPRASPDQLGLDGFEERLDGGVIIAISFTTHRRFEVMLAQDFLVIVRAVLGGFNRSSQHSILGGVDDNRQTKIRTVDAG